MSAFRNGLLQDFRARMTNGRYLRFEVVPYTGEWRATYNGRFFSIARDNTGEGWQGAVYDYESFEPVGWGSSPEEVARMLARRA